MSKFDVLGIDMSSCRICLAHKKFLYPIFDQGNVPTYSEMLTSCANVEVFHGDGFPDKLCCHCSRTLKSAYKLKITAEKSYGILKSNVDSLNIVTTNENNGTKKISFNSITDIKSELDALKPKPKLEFEIEILDEPMMSNHPLAEPLNGKDIVICNTVIRKIEPINNNLTDNLDSKKENEMQGEFLDDDFCYDDPDDEDYFPPEKVEKPQAIQKTEKTIFKVSTLEDIRKYKECHKKEVKKKTIKDRQSSYITYYPLDENGKKGAPVLLRRPKAMSTSRGKYQLRRNKDTKPTHDPFKSEPQVKRSTPALREKDCCPVCGLLTFSITKHMFTHEEKKPFQCEHCPRSFTAKSCFEVHIKKHMGIKDHVCHTCGSAFYSKKSILRHKLIHTGEKPFACNLCSKRFLLSDALKRHLTVHAGYKPYKCTECKMSFNTGSQLRTHSRMHTGERPYSCKLCNDMTFGYKVNMNNHAFRVHGINLRYKSIYHITKEVLEQESEAMSQARIQAEALLTMAMQHQPQPVPEDQITTQIVYDEETTE